MRITNKLRGGDRRSIGGVNAIVPSIKGQEQFDLLFRNMLSHERVVAMRAADAVEKVTRKNPDWLSKHKEVLLKLLHQSAHKELKWHVAQLITRPALTDKELYVVWDQLAYWLLNRNESKIVRVNAMQALYDLSRENGTLRAALITLVESVRHEGIASLNARIRKLHL